MVFQVRKTPLFSRDCGPGLGFRSQSHSPMVMGRVIDAITLGQLTQQDLLLDLFYLLLAAFGMYYLRYVWRMYILGTSYRLGQIMRSRLFEHFTKMSPAFYQTYRTGDLMAHATNDINALTRLAGGGVMSAVDASITALVTLLTMFFLAFHGK